MLYARVCGWLRTRKREFLPQGARCCYVYPQKVNGDRLVAAVVYPGSSAWLLRWRMDGGLRRVGVYLSLYEAIRAGNVAAGVRA